MEFPSLLVGGWPVLFLELIWGHTAGSGVFPLSKSDTVYHCYWGCKGDINIFPADRFNGQSFLRKTFVGIVNFLL